VAHRPRPPATSYLHLAASSPPTDPTPRAKTLYHGSEAEIAECVLDDLSLALGELGVSGGALRFWSGTYWGIVDDRFLQDTVLSYDAAEYPSGRFVRKVKMSNTKLVSLIKLVFKMAPRPACFDKPAEGIPLLDAFLHIADGRVVAAPHRPENGNCSVIPAKWSNTVVGPPPENSLLHHFLGGLFKNDPEDAQKLLLLSEIAGAALTGMGTRLSSPAAVILLGETAANGKSQFLELLRGLVADEAHVCLAPGDLENQRHLVQLAGKTLNAADEISDRLVASERLKAAVTGEMVLACAIYEKATWFRPIAQHVFTANALPTFLNGLDAGVLRRLKVLRFDRTIPPAERIPGIGRQIIEDELALAVGWAISGALRLSLQDRFTPLASNDRALKDMALQSNPVEAWLEAPEEVTITGKPEHTLRTKDAYRAFKDWARKEGLRDILLPTHTAFTQAVKRIGAPKVRLKPTSPGNVFVGLVAGATKAESDRD